MVSREDMESKEDMEGSLSRGGSRQQKQTITTTSLKGEAAMI